MLIHLYLLLLGLTATATLILVMGRDIGEQKRSLRDILVAATPILGIGLLATLALSANGFPKVEWVLPTAGLLLTGISRRSDRTFRAAAWGFSLASFVLIEMFFTLTSHDYTAQPGLSRIGAIQAANALRQRFPEGSVVPPGPVAKAVDDARFDSMPIRRTERLWHTPITRLHRIHRETAVAWTPGGAPEAAAKGVELRR